MKVYKVLRNVHKDTQILENNLNTLEQWSSEWQLSFNTTKCEVHTISETKDLGVYVFKSLNVQINLTAFLALLHVMLDLKTQTSSLNCIKALLGHFFNTVRPHAHRTLRKISLFK